MTVPHPNVTRASQRGFHRKAVKTKALDVLDDHTVRDIIGGSSIRAQNPNIFNVRIHNCGRDEMSEATHLAALFTTKDIKHRHDKGENKEQTD